MNSVNFCLANKVYTFTLLKLLNLQPKKQYEENILLLLLLVLESVAASLHTQQ